MPSEDVERELQEWETDVRRRWLARAYEYHINNDNLLAFRLSYGMVAQSMLVVAFVTIYVWSPPTPHPYLQFAGETIIATFGLWYSRLMHFQCSELLDKMRYLKIHYMCDDPIYRDYQKGYSSGQRSHQRIIPLALGCAWLGLISLGVISIAMQLGCHGLLGLNHLQVVKAACPAVHS
jgi:hypothetical protein